MRILISGTTRGIGRGLTEHLLSAGHEVIGCARSPATLDHPAYSHVQADITSEADVALVIRHVRARWNALDALVNNAGVARMLPLALTPLATARSIWETNVMGTFLLMHDAIRLLKKANTARIINLTSIAVPLRLQGEAIYASAKAAVEMLTKIAAKELGPLGITCNAIGPTPIRTDLIARVPEEKLQGLISQQAIPKWAEIADVANLVDFFLKPESGMITGQVIYLGGIS